MIVRELLTKLGFDLDQSGFRNAEAAFKVLVGFSTTLTGTYGLFRVAKGLLEITTATADAGDKARDAARATGLQIEEYQELAFAGKQAGVELALLANGIRFAQLRAAEAVKGNKDAAAAYSTLGIKVRGADGEIRPTIELFTEAADRISKIENPTKRAAAATELFGRSGTKLLPLLLEGAEGIETLRERARELGFVFDQESAEAADSFNDSLAELGLAIEGTKRRLGVLLIPVLQRVIQLTTDWIVRNRRLIDPVLLTLGRVMGGLVEVLLSFSDAIFSNSRFLIVLGGVITGILLPGLYSMATAWLAANAAALAAAAIPVLIAAAYTALGVLIALVIEDIYTYVSGGESLIGHLFESFLDQPGSGNDHWLVMWLRIILGGLRSAIVGVNEFFDGFFKYALEAGGIWEELKNGFGFAVDFWWEKLKGFVSKSITELGRLGSGLAKLPGFSALFPQLGALASATDAGNLIGGLVDVNSSTPGYNQGVPTSPRPWAGAPHGGASSTSVTGGSPTINIDARGNANADQIAEKTRQAVHQQTAHDLRETYRTVKSPVLR